MKIYNLGEKNFFCKPLSEQYSKIKIKYVYFLLRKNYVILQKRGSVQYIFLEGCK